MAANEGKDGRGECINDISRDLPDCTAETYIADGYGISASIPILLMAMARARSIAFLLLRRGSQMHRL